MNRTPKAEGKKEVQYAKIILLFLFSLTIVSLLAFGPTSALTILLFLLLFLMSAI